MVFHPRDPQYRNLSRRQFLRGSLATGLALPSAAAILAACGGDDGTTPGANGNGNGDGASQVLFGTPDNPVTLPTSDDNPPIDSDLEPEAGPLVLYNWEQYIWKKVADEFGKEFGVEVQIETFYNMEEAISKIQTGQVTFDVFFPTIDEVPRLVAAGLIQPLNHDYIPNLQANIWPSLADPFYDKGSQYSVPYAVYHTGIGWRYDLLQMEVEDVQAMDNPYSVFWEHGVAGKTGIYDVSRDALALAMYHLEGSAVDPNTVDPTKIDAAKQALIELDEQLGLRVTIEGAYVGIPEGRFALHQAWSGDMLSTPWYTADPAEENGLMRYYWPARDGHGGVYDNDTYVIPKAANNPVLAHHFLNYMLDNDHSMKNFSWVGYQAPLTALDPEDVIENGWPGLEGYFSWEWKAPKGETWSNLTNAIVREEDTDPSVGDRFTGIPLDGLTLWTDAFAEFRAGASTEEDA
jgi:spermidine/putrescine transport system substrate-binding protein